MLCSLEAKLVELQELPREHAIIVATKGMPRPVPDAS